MTMKRSISSKHTSLRAAASTPLVYSAREDLISASATSNARSNAQWETFEVPTGASVSNHRTNKLLDLAALRDSDLDKLKKSDPFMYYSIPHPKVTAARPDLALTRPKATHRVNERTEPNEQIRRNSSDSVLMVKRRSRISCEKHYDIDEMLEEIRELQAAQRGEGARRLSQILDDDEDEEDDNDESFSEFLYNIQVNPAASSA